MSLRYLVCLFCLLLLAAPLVSGQGKQEPPLPGGTLKVSTNVVNVYAVVRDRKGHLIPTLQKQDFEILDGKVPQEIRYFSRETDTPLTLGILVDTSPSQRGVLDVEKEQAKSFLQRVLRPKDMAFVMHFDLEVELLQDFTADYRRLANAIDSTVINGGGRGVLPSPLPTSGPCCTDLYDAIYLASTDMLKNEVGRKVLIMLTDGQDEGSKVKLEAALEVAQKSDVIIYSVAITDRRFYVADLIGFQGDSVLKKLSEETGGHVIEVQRMHDTAAAFQKIADELRTQYFLGYTPTYSRHDGSFRKIRVQVHNTDYKVQARRGYYTPTE